MDGRERHTWLKRTLLLNVALWLSRCFCLRSLQGTTLGSFGSMTPTCWMIRSGLVENTKGFSSFPPTWWENTRPRPTHHHQQQQQKQPPSCPLESQLRSLFSFKTNLNGGSFLLRLLQNPCDGSRVIIIWGPFSFLSSTLTFCAQVFPTQPRTITPERFVCSLLLTRRHFLKIISCF